MRFGGHKLNEQRTRTRFAFLPITIEGETRWLEKVTYVEEWYKRPTIFGHMWGWEKQHFID